MSNTNKLAFSNGMRDGIPIATGYFAVAFTLGIAAKNAGFTAIGVSWGYRPPELLLENGADFIAETPNDIVKFILG